MQKEMSSITYMGHEHTLNVWTEVVTENTTYMARDLKEFSSIWEIFTKWKGKKWVSLPFYRQLE